MRVLYFKCDNCGKETKCAEIPEKHFISYIEDNGWKIAETRGHDDLCDECNKQSK